MDVTSHNRAAWDREVDKGGDWTIPVTSDVVAAARRGRWEIFLTESKPVPRSWFPLELAGVDILCLASGGGQQGPILAAAGARVTVFDNSSRQLDQDRMVAERDGLELTTVQGDMADLSVFDDEHFDLIVHPASNCFVPDVRPVWCEACRVLRPGGHMMAGFVNPVEFMFDERLFWDGVLEVRHALPFSGLESRTEKQLQKLDVSEMLEFSHTLEDQIGGQLEAGFILLGFYEDRRRDHPVAQYMPSYIATRAAKPAPISNRISSL